MFQSISRSLLGSLTVVYFSVASLAVASLTASLVLLAPLAAVADYIPPGEVSIKTEKYQPQATDFAAGTYQYEIAWQGIPVAKAEVAVDEQELAQATYWHVKADAKTGSFVDMFYRLRFKGESLFRADSLRPERFVSDQTENSAQKRREIRFGEDGTIRSSYVHDGQHEEEKQFHSDNFTLDPISAAFVARSVPLEVGAKRSFDVFNGKHRYLITFTVEKREEVVVSKKKYDTFKVVPTVQKLTDSEGENRLKSASLWVTADDNREVVKLESNVLFGSVTAKLTKFTPKPGAALALNKKSNRPR